MKIPMHQNASHIYVGEGERTSVWCAQRGAVQAKSGGGSGGGGRCRSGTGGDWHRATSMKAGETGVEWWSRERQ
jgi:hypothetical protein